jgi:hypothetical protein
MREIDETKTEAIRGCESCAQGILDRDKFCRWCGALQSGATVTISEVAESREIVVLEPSRYFTTGVGNNSTNNSLRRVSGPLVSAVVASLSTGPVPKPGQSWFATTLAALLSLPLWLMIVLLSPFDAYAAAKNLSRGL